jgi:hypothetical protein
MNRRRSEPDPLFMTHEPTWLVVQDACSVNLEATRLAPHTDLRATLTTARQLRIGDGWDCEEIGARCSFFFCKKDGVRLEVSIVRRNPSDPILGHRAYTGLGA